MISPGCLVVHLSFAGPNRIQSKCLYHQNSSYYFVGNIFVCVSVYIYLYIHIIHIHIYTYTHIHTIHTYITLHYVTLRYVTLHYIHIHNYTILYIFQHISTYFQISIIFQRQFLQQYCSRPLRRNSPRWEELMTLASAGHRGVGRAGSTGVFWRNVFLDTSINKIPNNWKLFSALSKMC